MELRRASGWACAKSITSEVMDIQQTLHHHRRMTHLTQSFGDMLRLWRERRRISQLALALDAGISQRHLSFIESGRSSPGRDVVLRLAEHLRVPFQSRNVLLIAAGLAPAFEDRPLTEPDMVGVRAMIDRLLTAQEPFPALALDRGWTILAMNRAVGVLTRGVDPALLKGPVNALRLTFHPGGLSPRIVNLPVWRDHIFHRLAQDIDASGDPRLVALQEELKTYPAPRQTSAAKTPPGPALAVPLILRTPEGDLSFLSATTVFGTATSVALADIAIETFLPADDRTAQVLLSSRPHSEERGQDS